MTTVTNPLRPSVWPTPGSSSEPTGSSGTATPTSSLTRNAMIIDGVNLMDPDVMVSSLMDHYQSNALKWGMWGNIPMSAMYSNLARLTESNYRMLKHMFPHIYDGRF